MTVTNSVFGQRIYYTMSSWHWIFCCAVCAMWFWIDLLYVIASYPRRGQTTGALLQNFDQNICLRYFFQHLNNTQQSTLNMNTPKIRAIIVGGIRQINGKQEKFHNSLTIQHSPASSQCIKNQPLSA